MLRTTRMHLLLGLSVLLSFHSLSLAATSLESPDHTLLVPREEVAPTRSSNDNFCTVIEKQIQDPLGTDELIWVEAYKDARQQQCAYVCGDAVAKRIAEGQVASTSCISTGEPDWQPYMGSASSADDGMRVRTGNCSCNMPLIDDLAEDFVDALPAVGELGCNILMSAINLVIDIGSLAIPGGGAISGGMIAGIQAAKLAAYTYDAGSLGASAFSSWASSGMCGTSHLPSNIRTAFDVMNNITPMVLPKGSFFHGVAPRWPKGSGRAGDRGAPDATRANRPQTTNGRSPATTQKPRKCSQRRRRGPNDKDCDDDAIHITSIVRSKTGSLTTITETCAIQDYPQACAHYYYSAIHEGGLKDILTCEDFEDRADADATSSWKSQHNRGREWQDFTKPTYLFRGEEKPVVCQADEWPPGYFLPNDEEERQKPEWGQLIRWLPSQENGQAANTLWKSFCRIYDGVRGNGQRVDTNKKPWLRYKGKPEEQKPLRKELMNLGNQRLESRERGGTMTYTTFLEEVTFTRAVMTMQFDYNDSNKPKKENDWLLSANPCWPEDIVPDDPGFVLLTDDKWYQTHPFPRDYDPSKTKAFYSRPPSQNLVDRAELRRKQSGDKRGHSPDDSDGNQKRSERLEVVDNILVLRDDIRNITRRLNQEDVEDNLEVVRCADRACSKERLQVAADLEYVFVPGKPPPSRPAHNLAKLTGTTSSTFATSVVEVKLNKRNVSSSGPQDTGTSFDKGAEHLKSTTAATTYRSLI